MVGSLFFNKILINVLYISSVLPFTCYFYAGGKKLQQILRQLRCSIFLSTFTTKTRAILKSCFCTFGLERRMCIETSSCLVFILSKTSSFDDIKESKQIPSVSVQNNLFLVGTGAFLRYLMCKLLKHWAAKWRNLRRNDWLRKFSGMRPCDRYVLDVFFRTTFWLTVGVVFLKVSIMVLNVFRSPWFQLTSQNVLRRSASPLMS